MSKSDDTRELLLLDYLQAYGMVCLHAHIEGGRWFTSLAMPNNVLRSGGGKTRLESLEELVKKVTRMFPR